MPTRPAAVPIASRTLFASLASLVTLLSLAACSRPPAVDLAGPPPPAEGLYVDWDYEDYHVDRYLQINLKDFVTSQNLGPRQPAAAYRAAVTYQAPWDSLGLARFLRLIESEQGQRRQEARRHHAEARRIVLASVHHHRNRSTLGYLPNLSLSDMTTRPVGVETAVTEAIRHLTSAVGMDPSHATAWRDLAYFSGVAGDRHRQQRALSAGLAALDREDPGQITEGDHARLRRDIFLDLAWLAREQGQPALTVAYLDYVAPWLRTPSPEREDRLFEAQLLRGLAQADQGDWRAAAAVASNLPPLRVPVRSLRGGVREDLRWHLSAPNREQLGYDRAAWPRRSTDLARRWIRAQIGAPSGEPAHTVRLLGAPPTDLELPARLASRYWQDRGRLHDLAGDHLNAGRCYQWAAYYRPYLAFFPLRAASGPARLDEPARDRRYYTGYGMFFVAGDRGLFQHDLAATLGALP